MKHCMSVCVLTYDFRLPVTTDLSMFLHNKLMWYLYCMWWYFLVEYLRGFEAVAETSFVATDSHYHTFEWQKYGLRLHIPGGQVPAEHTEYRVDIKAGFTGQFNIPDDLQLVSCVYWLSCPHKFVKPVTLEIEHCALLQDLFQSSTVKFIVARCSQTELPYQFRVLDKGTFVPRSSYGSIEVSQFSFFGIGIPKRFQSLRRYYCTHHYIQKDVNQWDVDFIITTGLEASLTVSESFLFISASTSYTFILTLCGRQSRNDIPILT